MYIHVVVIGGKIMEDKLINISCPYCGTVNAIEEKTCFKCGNRIPKSAIEKAKNSKNEPPIAIRESKNDNSSKQIRKAISPLRRRGSVIKSQTENEPTTPESQNIEKDNSFEVEVKENVTEHRKNVTVEIETSMVGELGDAVNDEKQQESQETIEASEVVQGEIEKDTTVSGEGSEDHSYEQDDKKDAESDHVVQEDVVSTEGIGDAISEVIEVPETDSKEEPEVEPTSVAKIAQVEDQEKEEFQLSESEEKMEKTVDETKNSFDEERIGGALDQENSVSEEKHDEAVDQEDFVSEEKLDESDEQGNSDVKKENSLYNTNFDYIAQDRNKTFRGVEEELDDEIILHDDYSEGEEIIDIKPQNDIVKIKNDISEYLKAQEEIDLDTTVCLNVPDVMNALYKSEANEDDEYFNTHVYPNLEAELYESTVDAAEEGNGEESLYEEDDTDLETREYQLDMQVLEDNKANSSNTTKNNQNLASKIKKAHKENKDKKAADETRLNFTTYFLGILLKPFTMYEREQDKLKKFKNIGKFVLFLIFTMTILGFIREVLSVVRETSYWTGKMSWAWDKFGEIQYFKVLGNQLLIYTGIIGGFSAMYYMASILMKKKSNILEIIGAVCTAFIPFGVTYGFISLVLSLINTPISVAITIFGFIYSMLILLELIDEIVKIEEKNKRLAFHLISLSILFIIIGLMVYNSLTLVV